MDLNDINSLTWCRHPCRHTKAINAVQNTIRQLAKKAICFIGASHDLGQSHRGISSATTLGAVPSNIIAILPIKSPFVNTDTTCMMTIIFNLVFPAAC